MAHDFVKDMFEVEDRRSRGQTVLILIGGTLLITSIMAGFLFDRDFYAPFLALIAALLLGTPLVVQAFRDVYRGHLNMNELAALAVVAALATGQYLTAGAVSFFMVLSILIESRSTQGAKRSIESLIRLTPTQAKMLTPEGEVTVDATALQPGHVVRIRPGENIPGDGDVVFGHSTVNQATITGESIPVEKKVKDKVFAGTQNMTGLLDVVITHPIEEATLGKVKALIAQAEASRTPVMRLIDQYAGWHTPVVLMIAGIVLFFTRDLERAIAILVVACPSTMILAGPTATLAALSAASRLGILIKNVVDLETARHLTAIVFDKTGTLTTGVLHVVQCQPVAGITTERVLQVAASALQHSNHPVARAVVEAAERDVLALADDVADFEERPGQGVRASIQEREILVGRASWIVEWGAEAPGHPSPDWEGLSLLYVAEEGRLLGTLGLEDQTRSDAAMAMDQIRALDVNRRVMVTGDRQSVAERVSKALHCTDLLAEALPEQKLHLVSKLKADGHTVAVIGDGVNDAPALAAGHISIAMGAAGSDVAIHSARIALMHDELNRIPFLLHLSRRTMRVIQQNLWFSVVYLVGLLALSAAGWIHPVLAVILHTSSDLVVIFNSARLVREGETLEHHQGAEQTPSPSMPFMVETAPL